MRQIKSWLRYYYCKTVTGDTADISRPLSPLLHHLATQCLRVPEDQAPGTAPYCHTLFMSALQWRIALETCLQCRTHAATHGDEDGRDDGKQARCACPLLRGDHANAAQAELVAS